MAVRVIAVVGLACLCFGAGALAYSRLSLDNAAGPPAVEPAKRVDLPPPAAQPTGAVVADPAPANANPANVVKMLRLPDGSDIAPLNGVTEPAVFAWGEGPYSPIVGTEHGNGVDWYVHADGTRSTTLEIWRAELGRLDPVTLVYRSGGVPAAVDPGK